MKHKTRKGCKSTLKKTRRIQRGGALINAMENGVVVGEYDDVTGMGRANYEIGIYEGHFLNDNLHGQGKLTFTNGSIYEGEWRDNEMFGQGKLTYSDGNFYEGEWRNDEMNGQGKMTYSDGSTYEGQWLNNKRNGKGKLTYSDGDIYEGEWRDNQQMNGQGKLTFVSGNVYEGEFNNGAMVNGVLRFTDGAVYDGEWADNEKNGRGTMTFADGNVYDGNWLNNYMNGRGKMTYADGDVYDGNWLNNYMNGRGTMTFADGTVYSGNWLNNDMYGQGVYEGELEDGLANGHGKCRFINGNVYQGEWSADYCHGRGKMTYANGDVYVGPWNYDNRHGADGEMTYADGRVYAGEWWNDNMHGDGTMKGADGSTIYDGLWRENRQNPLFNPETGALADNAEYNARRPPKIFPISDNMLYQSDTYEYYDLGEMEDRHVLEALEEDPDAIALKVNRTYYVVSMYSIVRVANNKNFIQYECPILVDLDVNQRDLERVIKTEPYLSINGMGIQLVGVVSLFDIWSAIKSGHRAFELVGTRRVLLSTASHNTMFAYGSLMASNHCQSGIPATVYELQRLRIAVAPPRIKPTRHAKLFRIKKNGTKKLNRVINFMRGVRKQSHVRTQSRGQ